VLQKLWRVDLAPSIPDSPSLTPSCRDKASNGSRTLTLDLDQFDVQPEDDVDEQGRGYGPEEVEGN
jgi:hypothetical protein